jgi:hypothetical protein
MEDKVLIFIVASVVIIVLILTLCIPAILRHSTGKIGLQEAIKKTKIKHSSNRKTA